MSKDEAVQQQQRVESAYFKQAELQMRLLEVAVMEEDFIDRGYWVIARGDA